MEVLRPSQLEAKLNKDTETLRQDDSLRNLDEEHHSFFVCLFVYMSVLDRDERVVSRN